MTGRPARHFGENIVEILPNPESSTVLEMRLTSLHSNPASPRDSQIRKRAAGPEAEALQALADTLARGSGTGGNDRIE